MRYLLDTCVVSELIRPKPASSVVQWVAGQPEENLYLSVITLGEICKGIERLSDERKRVRLQNWLQNDLKSRFAERWLAVDNDVAERWGLITAMANKRGIAIPVMDCLIAATALVHGMTAVSRNVGDMKATGALTFNPWNL